MVRGREGSGFRVGGSWFVVWREVGSGYGGELVQGRERSGFRIGWGVGSW